MVSGWVHSHSCPSLEKDWARAFSGAGWGQYKVRRPFTSARVSPTAVSSCRWWLIVPGFILNLFERVEVVEGPFKHSSSKSFSLVGFPNFNN